MAIPGLDRFDLNLFKYALPYFIFILYLLFLLVIRGYFIRSKIIDVIFILSITFFAGLKHFPSFDFKNYRFMFEHPNILSIKWIEPGFILIVYFVHFFSDNYLLFFSFYEFITVLFIYLSINKVFGKTKNEYILAWMTFICLPFMFLNSFGVEIRQALAYSVFLYASISYAFGERKKAIIFFIVSILSHYSAIFAITIWIISMFLLKKIHKIKNKGIIFLLAIIITIFIARHISDIILFILQYIPLPVTGKYMSYLLHKEVNPISKIFVFNIFGLISALLIDKVKHPLKIYSSYFVLIGILLLDSSLYFSPVSRIAYYFLIYLIVFIPYISNSFRPHIISSYLLYIFLFSSFLYGLFYITPCGKYAFLPCRSLICNFLGYAF